MSLKDYFSRRMDRKFLLDMRFLMHKSQLDLSGNRCNPFSIQKWRYVSIASLAVWALHPSRVLLCRLSVDASRR